MNMDLHSKLEKLSAYAAQGKWNNVVEFASHYKAAAALAVPPDQQQQQHQQADLAFTMYKVLALMRLRRFGMAGDELAQLGDLPAQQLSAGSSDVQLVPFGLLYLRSQLPACLGSPHVTLDLLYQLQDYCHLQQQQAQQQCHQHHLPGHTPVQHDAHRDVQGRSDQQHTAHHTAAAAVALWQQRLHAVDRSLVLHYWQQGSVITAFKLLDQQLKQQPQNIELWSLAGRLQLQLNMLQQAHASFTRVQQLVQQQHHGAAAVAGSKQEQLASLQQLVHHNWGCYHALSHNMTLATHEFVAAQQVSAAATAAAGAAAATDPLAAAAAEAPAAAAVDGVAAANSAICLLHMGQLTEAISSLEAGLQQDPQAFLQECTLYNLGMMYDLAYPPSIAKQTRHQLASSVLRLAADDFDLSCIEPSG